MKLKPCCLSFQGCRGVAQFAVIARFNRRAFSRLLTCRAHRGVVASAFKMDGQTQVEIRRRRREVRP